MLDRYVKAQHTIAYAAAVIAAVAAAAAAAAVLRHERLYISQCL
jgi:hypothetical protein